MLPLSPLKKTYTIHQTNQHLGYWIICLQNILPCRNREWYTDELPDLCTKSTVIPYILISVAVSILMYKWKTPSLLTNIVFQSSIFQHQYQWLPTINSSETSLNALYSLTDWTVTTSFKFASYSGVSVVNPGYFTINIYYIADSIFISSPTECSSSFLYPTNNRFGSCSYYW